jgi:hypothetical protein
VDGLQEEGEDIRVMVLDREAALGGLEQEGPHGAWVAAGLMWLTLNRDRLLRLWGEA